MDGAAQFDLATRYFKGDCVPLDRNVATEWLHSSVRLGNSKGQALLGLLMHKSGYDGESFKLAKLAARQGNPDGEALLAFLYAQGAGAGRDDYQAAKWAQLAANQNNSSGQIVLASLYKDGRGGLSKDFVQADKWLIIAQKSLSNSRELPSLRKELEQHMTKNEVEATKSQAAFWKPSQ